MIGCMQRGVCGQSAAMLFLVETNTVGVFWSFQPLPDVLPAAEDGREIEIVSAIEAGDGEPLGLR